METPDQPNSLNTPNTSNPINLPPGLVERVKAILMKPKAEWPVIEAEPATIGSLYTKYALILAAIPAVATFLRATIFGYGAFGFSWRPGIVASLGMAISQYVLALVGVALLALITDFVVTKFDGTAHRLNAFKLAIYGGTAAWLAGIFGLVPGLSVLSILGLYSIYLFYTGLPVLMKVPQDKALVCTVVVGIVAVVLSLIAGALMRPAMGLFAGGYAGQDIAASGGAVTVPGLGTIDTAKLEESSKHLEAVANGKADLKPVDPAALKAMLPERLGGYTRSSLETSSMGAGSVGGAQASAAYALGDRVINVELTDMAAMGALAGMGAALNINQEKETSDGFDRTRTENGQMVQEAWSNSSHSGHYKRMVGGRFMISVDGQADSFDTLKTMGASFSESQLASLAR